MSAFGLIASDVAIISWMRIPLHCRGSGWVYNGGRRGREMKEEVVEIRIRLRDVEWETLSAFGDRTHWPKLLMSSATATYVSAFLFALNVTYAQYRNRRPRLQP